MSSSVLYRKRFIPEVRSNTEYEKIKGQQMISTTWNGEHTHFNCSPASRLCSTTTSGQKVTSTTWKGKHTRFNRSPRQYKCSICNQQGHNRRTCPTRKQAPIEEKEHRPVVWGCTVRPERHSTSAVTIQKYARRMLCIRRIRTALCVYEELHQLPQDTATFDEVMHFDPTLIGFKSNTGQPTETRENEGVYTVSKL
jgi:hypothetical protein